MRKWKLVLQSYERQEVIERETDEDWWDQRSSGVESRGNRKRIKMWGMQRTGR